MLNPNKIKEDFPLLKRKINGHPMIYFDNAATTQKPNQVINAIRDFYENHNANVHRAVHTLSQESSSLYEEAHELVGTFINANSMEEIIFLRGTTEAINLVAYAWGLRELRRSDEVLVTLMDHHSNMVPWQILSRMIGFRLLYSGINDDGTLNYESFEDKISTKTKIVCLPQVSNVTGVINDVKKIARISHDHGALLLVDGAQSVPHMPIDVRTLDADFLAFSGHKMLGPTGIGVLYGKQNLLEKMQPFQGGGSMIKEVLFNNQTRQCKVIPNVLPWKFEAGTPNISGGVGLMAAVKYLQRIGMENVKAHEELLTKYATSFLKEIPGVRLYGPQVVSEKCGILPFNVDGLSSHDVALFLDSFGIMARSGVHCAQPFHKRLKTGSTARVSFYIYNTRREIDRLVQILEEIKVS